MIKKVKPNIDNCILVDYDFRILDPLVSVQVNRCLAIMHLDGVYIRYDKTRRGWHIIIAIKQRLTRAEMLLAQAVMCAAIDGDWKREACNFVRARRGIYLNQLFEVKR